MWYFEDGIISRCCLEEWEYYRRIARVTFFLPPEIFPRVWERFPVEEKMNRILVLCDALSLRGTSALIIKLFPNIYSILLVSPQQTDTAAIIFIIRFRNKISLSRPPNKDRRHPFPFETKPPS